MTDRTVDHLLHYMPAVIREVDSSWVQNFAKSVLRQSKHKGWEPSPKQREIMDGLVDELFGFGGGVIENDE